MTAYYNEFNKEAAAWLRELIKEGHIAPGHVDERSIEDVYPSDLRGFTQCHFFAGIGVWSHALRSSGWRDDRSVWTGSCPCQPFSAAGKGAGFDDERHLWPAFHHLIKELKPECVLGEQVASKDADAWIDLVHTDLEALGYAFGAVAFPSAGVGAPHIRDRVYWVGDSGRARLEGHAGHGGAARRQGPAGSVATAGVSGGVADDASQRFIGRGAGEACDGRYAPRLQPERLCNAVRMSDDSSCRWGEECSDDRGVNVGDRTQGFATGLVHGSSDLRTGPVNGFWRDADWLGCRDDKWRPTCPKPQPLVDGSSESLGRVRPEIIKEIEGEINAWSMESQINRDKALRDLLLHLGAQSHACWTPGGIPGLHEAPFLLSFLRQLAQQGWGVAQCLPISCEEIAEASMRGMRLDGEQAGTPHRYGLEKQQSGERADVVPFLSSLLARHALAEWGNAYAAHAEIGFPLTHNARSRVVRLRGYGNAINAQAAKAFIESVMEAA